MAAREWGESPAFASEGQSTLAAEAPETMQDTIRRLSQAVSGAAYELAEIRQIETGAMNEARVQGANRERIENKYLKLVRELEKVLAAHGQQPPSVA